MSPGLSEPHPSTAARSPDLPQQQLPSENRSPDLVPHPSADNSSHNDKPHCSSKKKPPDLPELPSPVVLSLEAPPSPVAMVRMSPKVAASLEKIDQVLAAAGGGDSSDSVSPCCNNNGV